MLFTPLAQNLLATAGEVLRPLLGNHILHGFAQLRTRAMNGFNQWRVVIDLNSFSFIYY